jgi:hypothetical protein
MPHYYVYEMVNTSVAYSDELNGWTDGEWTRDGQSMTLTATGDLDCDGIKSVFIVKLGFDHRGEVLSTPVYLEDSTKEFE